MLDFYAKLSFLQSQKCVLLEVSHIKLSNRTPHKSFLIFLYDNFMYFMLYL